MSDAPRRSIHALATSWPYRAAPFGPPVGALSRLGPRSLDQNTEKLRRSLEPRAQSLARGRSINSIHTIIEGAWFPGPMCHSLTLAQHITKVASQTLEQSGPVVRLAACAPDERARRAYAWRSLSLYLPQDLLIAALPNDAPASCDRVDLLDPLLARMLEAAPVADTHVHAGAAFDFGRLWLALSHVLTWGPASAPKYEDTDDGLHGGREHKQVLTAAMLVRHLILAFLWHRSEGGVAGNFQEFLRTWLEKVQRSFPRRELGWDFFDAIGAAWSKLHLGPAREASMVVMRRALRVLAGSRPPKIHSVEDLITSDPVAQWLGCGDGLARPETRLLQRAIAYLRDDGKTDDSFAGAFWQYVRVRNLVYGRVGLGLAAIEPRTTPESTVDGNRALVRALARQAANFRLSPGRSRPQVGLVFHFIKKRESSGEATPDAKVFATRFGRWFHDQSIQAREVGRMLEYQPETLLILRGLDIASSELGVPNWPLLPLFDRVRRCAARAAKQLARTQPGWRVEGISTTLHLGEEFRRLNDGLRRVHEAIEFGLLRPGDRIGHGLALGWDSMTWASGNPCVPQAREDRLDDLLWEIDRYEAGQIECSNGRLAFVRAQAQELAANMYGKDSLGWNALPAVQLARRQRFEIENLQRLDYPRRCRLSPPRELDLLYQYLTDLDTYQRGAELIDVHVDDAEVEFLARAQRWLRHQLALLGVTIESNPSSNLVIGDFADLRTHPTFRLAPLPGTDSPLDGRLPVSINTDDPISFATCLADEYAHMYFALIGQGVPTRDALAWLDQARDAGWRSRFTLPASADCESLKLLLPKSENIHC